LVTPEGDALVFVTARYGHADAAAIRQILSGAADFDLDDDLEPGPDGALQFGWYETSPGARPTRPPLGQRVLATLTLTPTTLEVETMSEERLENCAQRLAELLGDRIHLVQTQRKSVDQVLQEEPPASPPEPLILPPETLAEMEEQMLRQWIDESIPALDGLTPREAVKTPEGRQRVLDLLDYIERMQQARCWDWSNRRRRRRRLLAVLPGRRRVSVERQQGETTAGGATHRQGELHARKRRDGQESGETTSGPIV
jgi:hypothetical protein